MRGDAIMGRRSRGARSTDEDGVVGGVPDVPGIEVLELLGEGGSATVWRGRAAGDGRRVAVKVLGTSAAGHHHDLHRRESAAAEHLHDEHHPAIVEVSGGGTLADGRPYLLMELLEGGTLSDRLRHRGPMTWDEATGLAIRLAGALETAHRCGVLHRDVKPANVIADADGRWKLGDFGVARMDGDPRTQTGHGFFSVSHSPPEVFSGAPSTPQRDVWSLASTLFECLSGHPPFGEGDTPLVVMGRLATESVPDLRSAGVPDDVCTAIERALDKEPTNRHPSAMAFADELAAARAARGLPRVPCIVTTGCADDATVIVDDLPPAPGALPKAAPTRRRTAPLVLAAAALLVALAVGAVALATGVGGGAQTQSVAAASEPVDGEPAADAPTTDPDVETTEGDAAEADGVAAGDGTAQDEPSTEATPASPPPAGGAAGGGDDAGGRADADGRGDGGGGGRGVDDRGQA